MIISAIGDIEDTVRLMVKEVKNKRKEWKWINNLTKGIGTNKGIYDIFFVNSAGVKVNIGKGTKISILSRERLQKVDVYYIKSSSENVKIDSKKEEHTVKPESVKLSIFINRYYISSSFYTNSIASTKSLTC